MHSGRGRNGVRSGLGRGGGVDVRALLTILIVAVVTLSVGFAIGMWLGS